MRFDPSQTTLYGVPTATLQKWLADAQKALQALMIGGQTVVVSYEGKSVTYQPSDQAQLQQWIFALQCQLYPGRARRRALRPYFR